MQLGMVGLGRMGANMVQRLLDGGHSVVAFDLSAEKVDQARRRGATGAGSLEDLVAALEPPRAVWAMVPAGDITQTTLDELASLLDPGDLIVDGGNSHYVDTVRRAAELRTSGLSLVDAGTSGGIWGLKLGYCLMVGADEEPFALIEPALRTLAPQAGYAHVGGPGTGHFVKMVHNGIEYALMQAYAEGFELMHESDLDIDVAQVAEVWRHGSVVRSWLLDLAAEALAGDPTLESLRGYVEDSGEGRWTVEAAMRYEVPVTTIAASLFARFASRRPDSFSNRLLAALRQQFGGHAVRRNG